MSLCKGPYVVEYQGIIPLDSALLASNLLPNKRGQTVETLIEYVMRIPPRM